MSDVSPPIEPPSSPQPDPQPHGFAALPRWAKIAIPVAGVMLLTLIGLLVWQASDANAATVDDALEELADEKQTVPTTIPPPITTAAETTTTQTATTAEATTTTEAATTTVEATTTTEATTTVTTVATATTAPATTTSLVTTTTAATTTTEDEATTTEDEATTTEDEATTTEDEATTTEDEPTTTEDEPTTTEDETTTTTPELPPQIPVPPGSVAADARQFAATWNANVAGTDVPQLTQDDVTSIDDGPTATTFIASLSDRVGLVGVVRNDDDSLAEVLLAWIPGGDEEASNQLYRDAFDVLVQTVNPALSAEDRADLATTLGLSPAAPPFTAGQTATAEVFTDRYTAYVRATRVSEDTAVISVVDARPR